MRWVPFFSAVLLAWGSFALLAADTQPSTSPTTLTTPTTAATTSAAVTSAPTSEAAVTTAPAATEPAATTAPADFVQLADLNTQLDQADQTVRGVNADLAPDALTPQYLNDLPSFRTTLKGQLDDVRAILNSRPTVEELRGRLETWQDTSTQLETWKSGLRLLVDRLDTDDRSLHDLATTLATKQKTLSSTRVPKDVLDRMDRLQKSIAKARSGVDVARLNLLSPQTQIAQDYDQVNQLLAEINAGNKRAVGQLFEKDSPPIWSAVQSQKTEQLLAASQDSFNGQWASLEAYAARESGRIILHALVTLGVVLVLIAFRRQITAWGEADPHVKRKLAIFRYPVAVGLLLCMTGNAWIYPDAPRLLWLFLGPITLGTSLWLLFSVLDRSFRPVLIGMAAFYVANLAELVTAGQPVISRVLYLAEMLAAVVFTLSLVHGERIEKMFAGRHRLISAGVLLLLRLAGLLLVAALMLNAVGYVGLSKMIGNGVLYSAIIGVIFNAAAMAIDGLIVLLFRIWPLTRLNLVRDKRDLLSDRLELVVAWAAVLAWLFLTLKLFQIENFALAEVQRVWNLSIEIGAFELSLRNIVRFCFAVWASFALSRLIRFVLEEDVYPRLVLPRGTPYAISTLLHYLVLLLGFYAAITSLGLEKTDFALLAGAFGVGLGFGLQNIVNNFVSGIIVLFERPLQVGDTIEIDGLTGVVSRIGIRASVVRTTAGSDLIVPNSRFIGEKVTNWTFSSGQRAISLPVSVANDTPPKVVMDLLLATATAHPLVANQPPPQVLLTGFAGGALTVELQAWTKRYEDWTNARSELAIQVLDAMSKAGIAVK